MNEQDRTYEQTIAEMQSVINSVLKERDEFLVKNNDLEQEVSRLSDVVNSEVKVRDKLYYRFNDLQGKYNKLLEEREYDSEKTELTISITDHENALKEKDAVIEKLMHELVWHRSAVDDDLKACTQRLNLVQAEYDGFKEAVKIMAGKE